MLRQWSYIFLALTHRFIHALTVLALPGEAGTAAAGLLLAEVAPKLNPEPPAPPNPIVAVVVAAGLGAANENPDAAAGLALVVAVVAMVLPAVLPPENKLLGVPLLMPNKEPESLAGVAVDVVVVVVLATVPVAMLVVPKVMGELDMGCEKP